MAIGGADHAITLVDMATTRTRQRLTGSLGQVNCVVFSPDGRTLASTCADGTATLWDVSSGKTIRILTTNENGSRPLIGAAFSPDGKELATASLYSGIALWDVLSGHQLESPEWLDEFATAMAFSPAGKTLAWGTVTGTIEIWDIAAGRRISAWHGHSGTVKSLVFLPDVMTLASGGDDGRSPRLVQARPETVRREAAEQVGPTLQPPRQVPLRCSLPGQKIGFQR